MRLAAHPHHNSWSMSVPSWASSLKACQILRRDDEGGCTIMSGSEGRRVWRNTPVPHLNGAALTSRSMEAMLPWGQLQVLARKGTRLGG